MTTPASPAPALLGALLERLGSAAFEWYRYDETLPCARDHEVALAVETYRSARPDERESAAAAVDAWSAHTLTSFAERACSWGLRTRDAARLHQAAIAVAWQWLGCEDPCDGIAVLAAVHDAAERVGLSPSQVFASAGAHAPRAIAPAFTDFLLRPDLDEIAAVMGYAVKDTGDGLQYCRSW